MGKDPKVAELMCVAALVPEEGQSGNDVNASKPTTGIEKEFRVSQDGFVSLSMKGVKEHFAPDASSQERKLIYATQVPLGFADAEQKSTIPHGKLNPHGT